MEAIKCWQVGKPASGKSVMYDAMYLPVSSRNEMMRRNLGCGLRDCLQARRRGTHVISIYEDAERPINSNPGATPSRRLRPYKNFTAASKLPR